MNDVREEVLTDLAAEGDRLEQLLTPLDEAGWRTPTPAPGWDIATTIAHLAWTDEMAINAASDKEAWDASVVAALSDPEGYVDTMALEGGRVEGAALMDRWRSSRTTLPQVLRELPAGAKLPWYGPPMSATSMGTARFMETWAHALDVADALGVTLEPTDRVKHVCHIGVRTRNFSFATAGLDAPAEEFRVELVSPSGASWAWGPEDAGQRVRGSAQDFAALVTQRVHRDDTDLVAEGDDAQKWLEIAQAFAGPPGQGRESTKEQPHG